MAKKDEAAEEMTAPHRLPAWFAFAVVTRVAGSGIAGEVLAQDGPWTVTVQKDRAAESRWAPSC